jgi:hypothetical protein
MSDARLWSFTRRAPVDEHGNPVGDDERRTFVQQELTLDGETQLFGLVAEAVPRMQGAGFPFDRIMEIFPDEENQFGPEAISAVAEMAQTLAVIAPDLVTRAAAVTLGIFPKDIDGKPNRHYDEQVGFLRQSMHTADVVEMFETFVEQNDVKRLQAPFVILWEKVTANVPQEIARTVRQNAMEETEETTTAEETSETPSPEQ